MHDLTITRFIAAPTDKVWEIMAHRTGEWWCPVPWRADVSQWDRRPGGSSWTTMYGPDGEVHEHGGLFLAWEEGRRFASTDAVTPDLQPAGPFMIGIWEVTPEGEGTRYTATARHWTDEARNKHAEMGFEQGWGACADQLAALCENP
ncbi:SRPBCC domain-containing protein [Novosphingobium flavum]|uniref:SRPBCC domain-containing protein n=1 Tax=Novosphingobium flavum TaxID=1778672 RepID=A0A7X1FNU8_9SPHN|nr:SRPBCC domain-containing protein [Novosphingobium flavum]MBC2664264.1 SRPBCC domain-containing protein [Novosphingobium flavum]